MRTLLVLVAVPFVVGVSTGQDFQVMSAQPVASNFLTGGTPQFPERPVGSDSNTLLVDMKTGKTWILVSRVVQGIQAAGQNDKWIQLVWQPIIFLPADSTIKGVITSSSQISSFHVIQTEPRAGSIKPD